MNTTAAMRGSAGFSLVEVLIALIVISVGMLGIAKMQALALSSTGSSGSRSLVAIEAAGLATSMHADRDFWSATLPSLVTNVNAANGSASIDVASLAAVADCSVSCTPTQIAAADLQNFGAALAQIVPAANANITCQNITVPQSCIITVTWLENITGLSAATSSAAVSAATVSSAPTSNLIQQPQYTLYVEP
jgi:type IV pilus assembly protein PilV